MHRTLGVVLVWTYHYWLWQLYRVYVVYDYRRAIVSTVPTSGALCCGSRSATASLSVSTSVTALTTPIVQWPSRWWRGNRWTLVAVCVSSRQSMWMLLTSVDAASSRPIWSWWRRYCCWTNWDIAGCCRCSATASVARKPSQRRCRTTECIARPRSVLRECCRSVAWLWLVLQEYVAGPRSVGGVRVRDALLCDVDEGLVDWATTRYSGTTGRPGCLSAPVTTRLSACRRLQADAFPAARCRSQNRHDRLGRRYQCWAVVWWQLAYQPVAASCHADKMSISTSGRPTLFCGRTWLPMSIVLSTVVIQSRRIGYSYCICLSLCLKLYNDNRNWQSHNSNWQFSSVQFCRFVALYCRSLATVEQVS